MGAQALGDELADRRVLARNRLLESAMELIGEGDRQTRHALIVAPGHQRTTTPRKASRRPPRSPSLGQALRSPVARAAVPEDLDCVPQLGVDVAAQPDQSAIGVAQS